MSNQFDDFGAKRRNADECERAGSVLREALGGVDQDRMPPVMEMLANARRNVPEAAKLDVVARSAEQMGDAAAFAKPDKCEIHVGPSEVEGALNDENGARFTYLHELVHVIFHAGAPFGNRQATSSTRFFKRQARES